MENWIFAVITWISTWQCWQCATVVRFFSKLVSILFQITRKAEENFPSFQSPSRFSPIQSSCRIFSSRFWPFYLPSKKVFSSLKSCKVYDFRETMKIFVAWKGEKEEKCEKLMTKATKRKKFGCYMREKFNFLLPNCVINNANQRLNSFCIALNHVSLPLRRRTMSKLVESVE